MPLDIRGKQVFSMAPGAYEYPFEFKVSQIAQSEENRKTHQSTAPFQQLMHR